LCGAGGIKGGGKEEGQMARKSVDFKHSFVLNGMEK
jgi:hypothetical protein